MGFANLPNQVYRKSVKRGFEFTLMVVGKWKASFHLLQASLHVPLSLEEYRSSGCRSICTVLTRMCVVSKHRHLFITAFPKVPILRPLFVDDRLHWFLGMYNVSSKNIKPNL